MDADRVRGEEGERGLERERRLAALLPRVSEQQLLADVDLDEVGAGRDRGREPLEAVGRRVRGCAAMPDHERAGAAL